MATRRIRPRGRARFSSTSMPPASTPPITRCGWEAAATTSSFRISWVATFPAWWRTRSWRHRFCCRRRGVRGHRSRYRRSLCREDRRQGRDRRQEAGSAWSRRGSGYGSDQPHRAVGDRGYGAAQSRRDHFNSRRRRRRRRLCHSACQASRREGDHDRQRRQPRLRTPPRCRPGDRLQC